MATANENIFDQKYVILGIVEVWMLKAEILTNGTVYQTNCVSSFSAFLHGAVLMAFIQVQHVFGRLLDGIVTVVGVDMSDCGELFEPQHMAHRLLKVARLTFAENRLFRGEFLVCHARNNRH